MALDDRIAVAAPSCFITSLERLYATIGPQDAEQNITGQVAAGMEHADYVTLHAPKPTFLSVGTRNFFDIKGSWDTFREVKLIFGRLGFGERVELFESDEEHGFTRPRRIATARWLKRWLVKQDEALDEPDFPINSDAELQCTRTGQVLSDFQDRSVFDLNAERARELRASRGTSGQDRSLQEFRKEVKERIGLGGRGIATARPRVVGTTARPGYTIRKLIFEIEPGIAIPALDLSTDQSDKKAPATVKFGVDWVRDLASPKSVDELSRPYSRVVLVNPRGMGETDPGAGAGRRNSPFGSEVKEAFLSILLDRPLLGQRVTDILSVLESLKGEPGSSAAFQVVGVGAAGPVVLHAALVDEKGLIGSVVLERSLVSWDDVVEKGISRGQLGNVVPGVLQSYDLPDLAARLSPRSLRIDGPVNAMGQPTSQAEIERAYAACIKAYGLSQRLEIRPGRPGGSK